MTEERTLLSGTAANVVGLGVGVAAAMGTQILLGRTLVPGAFGVVTVAVQVAFVASAGSRFGMDMAAVRYVAIGRGATAAEHLRSLVDRCALFAFAASILLAALLAASAPLFGDYDRAIALAALGIPFIALTSVYLGATRGLTQMRQTLYVFWVGQPVLWILLAGIGIAAGGETDTVVLAYDVSWLLASVAAWALWREESRPFSDRPATWAEVRAAIRYGLPRAPAALFAQAIFWVDLWVLAALEQGDELDAYAAAARISQVLLLFLTSLSLVFSPFAADLHARGQRHRLEELFKRSTRWALTATLPLLVVLVISADDVLEGFASRFEIGEQALRILLLGQAVNVATGSVGFILIMTGFTLVDLFDNLSCVVVIAVLAVPLTHAFGIEGTAAAAATGVAGFSLVRLGQVRRYIGIQPYDRSYLGLALPTLAAAAASLAAHVVFAGRPWWASLAVTAACGFLAYGAVLPIALPAAERAALRAPLTRMPRH